MAKITKTTVDKTEPVAGKDVFVWCSEVPGFGFRVQASGRKTYLIRYRNATGTQRKMTVARCCDMPPEKAREIARKLFGEVAAGKDPAADKREAREAPTMADLWQRYLKEHALPFKKASSIESDTGTWTRYILKPLGSKKAAEVTRSDVTKIFATLADRPAAGNHVIALLGKMFNLAEDWSIRPANTNPCRRWKKYKIAERECILTSEQIAKLDIVLDEMVDERDIPPAMAALVRLWLLTGCRNSEIRKAERSWVDFDRKILNLPDSKVGQRRIPLPDIALDIIRELPDGKWLIPGRISGSYLSHPWGMWRRIAERAGIPPGSRPHDLRHTVGSLGHDSGLSQKQVQMQLGHKQMSTTERYIHGVKSQQAKAAEQVADLISQCWKRAKQGEPV